MEVSIVQELKVTSSIKHTEGSIVKSDRSLSFRAKLRRDLADDYARQQRYQRLVKLCTVYNCE